MSPEVSVITPTYNAQEFIVETISSVQNQSFQDWEMVIVDDHSTDGTAQMINDAAAGDARIIPVLRKENGGAAEARNAGIRRARGRYIAFLDADDLWLSNKLERQLAFMRDGDLPFVFSAYHVIDKSGKIVGNVQVPETVNYRQLLLTNVIGCLTAIYDSKQLGLVEMPNIRKRQDFGLWLNLLKRTPHAFGMQEELSFYRLHEQSMSSNKWSSAQYNWHLYRKVENMQFPLAAYYFANYAIRGVMRKLSQQPSGMKGQAASDLM